MNPSSVDENMEYSDAEKDSDSKSTTVKASSSMSGLDEYEFKDEEEEEDLSKALNDRHILRRELRQKEKEEKERNHYTSKQGSKSDQSTLVCKSKKTKASRVYCSSDSSSDEAEVPTERRSSPTRSVSVDGHKTESRSKKESLTLTPVEQKEKGKQKKKNKSQSKNKENQEVREEGKENSKSILFTSATVSDNSDKGVREEDSFKMSFSAKDDTSVHLFHLSVVKSPKLNHSQTDKQTTPLKQENAKTCVSIGDGSCPGDGVKYNHYTESDFCTEGSSSKSCKHKEKSKHHHKEPNLDGDDGSSSPFKDSSLSNSIDSSEAVFRKTDKDGKVVKKHKLKHKEKEKYRKEHEAERNRHRQKEPRKDGHRNMEFDREFWKENFFKSDENEDLTGKCEMLAGGSPLKSSDSSPVKEERGASKDKHSSSSSSKERRPKEERDKDKTIKKEKKEVPLKEERVKDGRGDEGDDRTEGLGSGRIPDGSLHSSGVKEEVDDKPITVNSADQDQLESPEKNSREKTDKRPPTKDRESEKSDKKHADKDKKVKSEHLADKPELHNSTDRWKEKEKLTNVSHSPNDKSHKESEKLKATSLMKKHEENKKNKDKVDKRAEKEHSSGDHRDKDKTSSEKKGKAPEKTTDHGKSDRSKEKEREKDSDKRKKEKSKETTPSSSSYSNLKLLLEEKKGYVCENNKVASSKSKEEVTKPPEKDRDRRERDREPERHRDRERDRHKEKEKDRSQVNRDGKISKTKPSEVDSKSKVAPTLKDTRPKEKRLVNDDLMKTSFERMLSLKDQEIEQWHRKHLEKIKQKERERLKQRPGTDPGKQKSKEKTKTSSLSSEPFVTKELTRSKSSEAPDVHREKILKDATSGRTLSVDAKTLGKNGPVMENNLNRSPRPESEKSGLMSRSVSMVSVASSEDSCHATILTPKPTEYDSDVNMEASDSQPPFLQSSLILQSSISPTVHDKDTSSLPETALCNRTPLSSRHASPCLRAILDEEAKVSPAETRSTEESQIIGIVSHPSSEQAAVHSTEISMSPVQETQSSQSLTSALPERESLTSNEIEGFTPVCQVQPSPNLRESSAKDLVSLKQANSVFQTHLQEKSRSCNTSSQIEHASLGQLDLPGAVMTEGSNKESSQAVASQVASFQSSHTQNPSDVSSPLHSSSHQWETSPVSSSEQTLTADSSLRPEQREKPIVVSENKLEKCEENLTKSGWTSTPSPSIGSCRSSSEETTKPLLRTTSVQEDIEKGDASVQDESISKFSSEPLDTVDAQPEKHEPGLHAASVTIVQSRCDSPERVPEEPMELSEDVSDKNRITEMDGVKVLSSEEGATIQALSESKADAETSDQLAVEEKPVKSDLQTNEEQGQSSASVYPDHQGDLHSGATSGSSSPISIAERDCDTSGARAKVRLLEEEADMQATHPRKRKMHRVSPPAQMNLTAQQVKEKAQQSLAAIVDALKLEEIQPYQTERANPYYEYLHIRKKIEEKRKVLCSVIPQAPQYYDEYVTFNGSYLLDGNPLSKLCIPTVSWSPLLF